VKVSLAAMGPGIGSGRVVDDLVNLMDLAPTFLQAGGVSAPAVMTGRSLGEVLWSDKSGQVDPARTWVVTGRERHVGTAREGNLPYPQRALRTKDFLYIRNFAPDRWPLGAPNGVNDTTAPTDQELENDTFVAFADMDAGPTKAWLVAHRNDPQWKSYYERAFAKRPGEELYDLAKDPDQQHNVAGDQAYASQQRELSNRLMQILQDTDDPRVTGDGMTFERPPFTNPDGRPPKKPAK
jgi:N-sulfoglucosamine sulfohydrolase